jgi:hypothetical protein
MGKLDLSHDPAVSRRRSQRVIMSIPVTVKWNGPDGQEAEETTASLVLNAHGALLALATTMTEGQTLRLVNRTTDQEEACRVVYLGPVMSGKVQIGLEFLQLAPEFWHITFPPEDWSGPDAADRKSRIR